jgi:hypothetical protein
MSFDAILGRLDQQAAVEAVYLAARYLSHGLNRTSFERQLRSDIKTPAQRGAIGAVHEIVAEVEQEYGRAIFALPAAERLRIVDRLDHILARVTGPGSLDEAKTTAALQALRQQA